MKLKSLVIGILTMLVLVGIVAMTSNSTKNSAINNSQIKWYTLEEAVAANEKNPKKWVVDIYTDWCHWCKVMDKQTFTNPEVIQYMNENFYAVKFNGESKEKINFKGKEYKFVTAGRRGINTLAYYWLDGRAAYPTIVYLDENLEKLKKSPGFKKPTQLLAELKSIEEMSSTD